MKNETRLLLAGVIWGVFASIPAEATVPSMAFGPTGSAVATESAPAIIEVPRETRGFRWKSALRQSLNFLFIEHSFRLLQKKTLRELKGPFFRDYRASVKNLGGWGDGDGLFTNYVAHSMQGAVAGYIQVQNDPKGRQQEFGRSKDYWRSRGKALGWAAAYDTQFEIGPFLSEAAIGNVGLKKGTAGLVDLVITPLGGLGWMIGEDALERFVLRRLESRTTSARKRAFYRVLLNPTRSFAGLLWGKLPWQREKWELREANWALPRSTPFEFSTPEQDDQRMDDRLWPGMWCETAPNPKQSEKSTLTFPSLCRCSPGEADPEPIPLSILIRPLPDEGASS